MNTATKESNMIATDSTSRAGRMIEAGRVTVTFRSPTGQHITLTAKCRAPEDSGKWVGVPLDTAKIIFIEVPNQGGFGDKVGKVTRAKGFVADRNADPARAWCAAQLLRFVNGQPLANGLEAFEEERCGRCGRALTDPVSIERGIGPECYGMMTGSAHETKVKAAAATKSVGEVYDRLYGDSDLEPGVYTSDDYDAARNFYGTSRISWDKLHAANGEPGYERVKGFTPKVSDGMDKQGVAYGYGDHRARRAAAKKAIADSTGGVTRTFPAYTEQAATLPGTTWEDIFRPVADAQGIRLP